MSLDAILPHVARPARYTDHEWNRVRRGPDEWDGSGVRFLFAYPDAYEVGMSNLGLQILYDVLNREPGVLAERCYTPWTDMEAKMREAGLPLFSLESQRPAREFDILGFSLQFELNYTNVLNMLDVAGLPLHSEERDERWPLVIAGGTCALNAEPLTDFIDLFVLGEADESLLDLVRAYRRGEPREAFLARAAQIDGVYVPRFYRVEHDADGRVAAVSPFRPDVPRRPRRRLIGQLGFPPVRPVVPFVEAVHDRAMIDLMRGCTRGCRFCQAGVVYRPTRERPLDEVLQAADELLANTGYDELALVSLSSSDYSCIEPLVNELTARYPRLRVSLPSLRIDSFSVELAEAVEKQRRSSLTFAPEAGSERLRRVINKNVTEDDLLRTAEAVFSHGWRAIKLYFMIGLPGERDEDVEAIVRLVREVQKVGRRYGRREVSATISTFVPKAHTPFQWVGQEADVRSKQAYLRDNLRRTRLGWGDPFASRLEAVLARGDRRLGAVIEGAWRRGARFDAWSEHLLPLAWEQAFAEAGLDMAFYANRTREPDEVLPWDHINTGITKRFLWKEYQRSLAAESTPDCRWGDCTACGMAALHPACAQRRAT
ncbi:MAG: TIGR03960 family B12-binding radical SAM protein [Chloroflexi bacterium]|nr:TIGR03960 family B12-binding radical SAM protein [Chloroflexota bacterium]